MALPAELVQSLPSLLLPDLERLYSLPLATVDVLRAEVQEHLRQARQAARQSELVDLELAEAIATSCLGLIDSLEVNHDDGRQSLIQLACRYFVLTDDQDHDFDSMLGFDDDAQVLNAVARRIDRCDLCVEVP